MTKRRPAVGSRAAISRLARSVSPMILAVSSSVEEAPRQAHCANAKQAAAISSRVLEQT
jgi:hypothetical protein